MKQWPELTLEDALEVLIDYRGKSPKKSETGIPVISAKVVKSGRILDEIEQTISKEYYVEWMRRGLPVVGDVVMTTEGPLGEVAQLNDKTVEYALGQRIVTLRGKSGLLQNGFLKYLLMSSATQERLQSRATGSTVAGISQKSLRKMKISIAPLSVQEEIAAILGALDDKIELNRRMSATLEEMARSLYRSWFVDFDPVQAKLEGSAPAHMDPATTALFPDSFGENGLPKEWDSQGLLEQSSWVNGAAYKNMHFAKTDDALPVVKIAELKAGVTANTKFTATDLGEKYGITKGELLFSWSGNPDTSIDAFVWPSEDAWLNQHIFAVRPNGKMSKAMLFACLRFFKPEMAEIARNKQTTGLGHITRKDLEFFPVSIAPHEVTAAFDALVQPLFDRYCACLYQNQTLATLRDTLLPKLMSGELRVGEAREQLEDAV